ncbi:MAG TPA: 2OG-Fe(II) oxygenase [Burkholderiales bacterium]|nr:2OG-Fe(II) oxygenase [Burkholderiales bacterium]
MGMLVNFSPELGAWIRHNLDRGCAVEDVVNSMIAQKFEPLIARGLVEAFSSALSAGVDPPAGSVMIESEQAEYRYETPRLASGPVIRTADREIPVLLRLERPVLAVLDGVLSDEECDRLIELARHRLQPSTVVDLLTGEDRVAEHRDSEGMFFKLQETPFIAMLDRRISEAMNCPVENGEGLQVLRYGPGAKNTPHFDFLVPANPANQESLARSGQRISTMVIYLNDVIRGGETVFPEAGLSVLPRKGNGVYFEYANSLRQVDPSSAHAGGAVYEGEKWAVTKWMREKRFVPAALD